MTRSTSTREKLIRSGFRAAGAVAPRAVGRLAFRLFCTPPRRRRLNPGEERMAQRMAPLLARAERRMVAFDGGRVAAYAWRTEAGPARGRVLLVHGWSGRALVMMAFVEPLLREGLDVAALDLPGHGDSEGRLLSLPLGARSVQAVAAALGGVTGVVAHSFGGPVSALAAEGGPPLTAAMPVERIVLIASPNSMGTVTRRFSDRIGLTERSRAALETEIRRVARRPAEAFVVGEFLARLGKPALIIHDADDRDVPHVRAEEIVATAPASARLMTTTRVGHRRIVLAPKVIRAAARFLAEPALPAAPQRAAD